MNIIEQLIKTQSELKAPKGKFNSFGKYKYRSAEDILNSAKEILKNNGLYLNISDKIVLVGERYYMQSTATVYNAEGAKIESVGLAREVTEKKGMDEAQITGSASSYARKYALNGLFGIDESEADPDSELQQDKKVTETKISEGQLKRLFAIAKGKEETFKKIMLSKGYNSSKDILVKDYENICQEIEKGETK